ncbi:P protein-like [Antedon mediterranea]|uniref:P protein-like n=1 Tax=Antedon mediterranea TaxID=105859 RepID=UPI003AF91BF4
MSATSQNEETPLLSPQTPARLHATTQPTNSDIHNEKEHNVILTSSEKTEGLYQQHENGLNDGVIANEHLNGGSITADKRTKRSLSQLTFMEEQLDDGTDVESGHKMPFHISFSDKTKHLIRQAKIFILFSLMLTMAVIFSISEEFVPVGELVSVSSIQSTYVNLVESTADENPIIQLLIEGGFTEAPDTTQSPYNVTVTLVQFDTLTKSQVPCDDCEYITLALDYNKSGVDISILEPFYYKYHIPTYDLDDNIVYQFLVESTTPFHSAFTVIHSGLPASADDEVIYAALILIGVYILIGFELVNRTIAAFLGSMAVLTVLATFNERPTLDKVMEWVDYETLALLWGMMTIVAIFSDTGFFEYCALMSYKLAKGHVWTLITILCLFTAIVSAFLDNVTTILLVTPVTIRLCEVLNIDPKHVLIAEVLFSNIGGTATAVGDPPNVIIVSNAEMKEAGINFSNFTLHMSIGVTFCLVTGYILIWFFYRKKDMTFKDPPEIVELKHEIWIWRQTAASINVMSREESTVKALLMQKVYNMENKLQNLLYDRRTAQSDGPDENWEVVLEELEKKYKITDPVLLIKSSCVLFVAIVFFFIHSIEGINIYLDLGWIAVLSALVLLVLSDIREFEHIVHRIEWATLLFFAGLFILMEGLTELGLIDFIGEEVAYVIKISSDDDTVQLTVAILLLLWVSALASSFIDNIPYTTAMVPIVLSLSEDPDLNLPLEPLVWSLAFGACLGGNGTLIGASANVVCAGIAEQHGYRFSFIEFFKVGFPMMLVTTFTAMIYLLVCHPLLGWNGPD